MDFHLRIKGDYKIPICMLFFLSKDNFFLSKKRLQIEKFVKTCDKYVHNGAPNGHGDNGIDIQPSCTCTKKSKETIIVTELL